MTPQAINQELKKEPFTPFRLKISDGSTVDVHNPGLVFISNLSVYVFYPEANDPKSRVGDWRLISLPHVVSFEPIRTVAA